jgi:response regulator RpfG family c-di-GMP phosphodiesterase
MAHAVLMVDDEPNVLSALERSFRKQYRVVTATSGFEGLRLLSDVGPFAVVMSDMRMPKMNGAAFLARVRQQAPSAVRLMLTGETDIVAATRAVNEGEIFRFLLKPCPEPDLRTAIEAAVRQYELEQAEQFLLEKTLGGGIKVLTEMLSLANPTAFGQSVRIQRYVRHIIEKLRLGQESWQYEVAAMLSQIGCVTIPPQTLEAVQAGRPLPELERQRYLMHPSVAHDLLSQVPRLEAVALMVCRQNDPVGDRPDDQVAFGAQILRVCLAFDTALMQGRSVEATLRLLREQPREFLPQLVSAIADVRFDAVGYESRELSIDALESGMVADEEIRSKIGTVLATPGQALTFALIVRLRNFHQHGSIGETVRVRVPAPLLSVGKSGPSA